MTGEDRRVGSDPSGSALVETVLVWKRSVHGYVAILGAIFGGVAVCMGGGLALDTGPDEVVLVLAGVGVVLLAVAQWAWRHGKEPLVLRLDVGGDRLLVERSGERHEVENLAGMTRAWLHTQEVGRGPEDTTLYAYWIFIEQSNRQGRIPFPYELREGESKRVVAALDRLLASRTAAR